MKVKFDASKLAAGMAKQEEHLKQSKSDDNSTPAVAPKADISRRFARAAAEDHEQDPASREVLIAELSVVTGHEIIEVDVHRLHSNPFNPRHFYDQDKVAERGNSLKLDGQLVPILIGPVEHLPKKYWTESMREGDWVIIDGEYRCRGARYADISTLVARIDRSVRTPLEWHRKAHLCNDQREGASVFDTALALQKLFDSMRSDDPALTLTDFALSQAMDKASMSRILKIAKLPEPVAYTLHEGKIGQKTAYEVTLVWDATENARKTADFAREIVGKGLSAREAERLRQRITGTGPKRERRRPESYQFALNDAKGSLKTFDDGRLTLEITGLDEAARNALMEELRNRFAGDANQAAA
jgi:ParB family chromosome partitioning protein